MKVSHETYRRRGIDVGPGGETVVTTVERDPETGRVRVVEQRVISSVRRGRGRNVPPLYIPSRGPRDGGR